MGERNHVLHGPEVVRERARVQDLRVYAFAHLVGQAATLEDGVDSVRVPSDGPTKLAKGLILFRRAQAGFGDTI